MDNIWTVIITLLIGSPLMAVLTHIFNRRARHAEARLKNIEADKSELGKRRDEVAYYRGAIEELVSDMESLRLAQDETDKRYQENTDGLHRKIDGLTTDLKTANNALVQANKVIGELEKEGREAGPKTAALVTGLKRANDALDEAKKEIGELRREVKAYAASNAELRETISGLLVDRAEKGEKRKEQ